MAADEGEVRPEGEGERIAARLVAGRERTGAELKRELLARGVADDEALRVLESFQARGWLDDRRAASQHAAAALDRGHGRERVLRELVARGVPAAEAAEAWERAAADRGADEGSLLRDEVARQARRCGGRFAASDYRRVYNRLLRAGHDPEALRAELEPYRDFPDEEPNP